MRPRFENLTNVDEPGLLTVEAARRADLHAGSAVPEVSGTTSVGLSAAVLVPSSMKHAGMVGMIEASFGIPVAGPRLALGLYGGVSRTEDPRLIADDRAPLGTAPINLIVTMIPIVLDAHWSAPLPSPIAVEAGLGGGAVLLWTELRAGGVRSKEGVNVGAIGWLQVTALLEAGPGAVFVRVAFVAGVPLTFGSLRNFDPGGALAAFGYRLTLVGGD